MSTKSNTFAEFSASGQVCSDLRFVAVRRIIEFLAVWRDLWRKPQVWVEKFGLHSYFASKLACFLEVLACVSYFRVLSSPCCLSRVEFEVFVHMLYDNLLESSGYLWRLVPETRDVELCQNRVLSTHAIQELLESSCYLWRSGAETERHDVLKLRS